MSTQEKSKVDLFQFIVAIVLGLIAFVLMWQWGKAINIKGETVDVLVAKTDLVPPKVITRADVKVEKLPRAVVPKTAITGDITQAEGFTLIHPLSEGQMITSNELLSKAAPNLLGVKIPKTRYGTELPSNWFAGPIPNVTKGDFVNIVASSGDKNSTGLVSSNLVILDVKTDGKGISSVLVSLRDEEVNALVQARAAGMSLQMTVTGLGAGTEINPLK
jgi:Flp pilus assembly protein CpaB